jgi:glycosyltransferase involved in cell wall biosynthesis
MQSPFINDLSMDVSVVIPAFNNQETIARTLSALLAQKYSGKIEVIVVDDNSFDSTRKILSDYSVIKIFNEKNLGLAKSLNKGILTARHEIIVTLHADTIPVNSNWLEQLVSPLSDFNVVATCSTQFPPSSQKRKLTIWEKMVYSKLRAHQAFNNKADAYKKGTLQEIGLFDEKTYRTAGEDEDLCFRLKSRKKLLEGTSAFVIHDHYFYVRNGDGVLKQILRKEYSFGRAGGALRRKYPKHRLGSYIYPKPKSFANDGLFRFILCMGALVPYVQLVFIPLLFATGSVNVTKIVRDQKYLTILYPFFNVLRFYSYSAGYAAGLAIGRQ